MISISKSEERIKKMLKKYRISLFVGITMSTFRYLKVF
jgi:hypothetical protein